jgi:hypothetical protein
MIKSARYQVFGIQSKARRPARRFDGDRASLRTHPALMLLGNSIVAKALAWRAGYTRQPTPEGIKYFSPGLRVCEVLRSEIPNPGRVASKIGFDRSNPVGVDDFFDSVSQGSSQTRNPGLKDTIPLESQLSRKTLAGYTGFLIRRNFRKALPLEPGT